ncbi:pyridoxamine 5'-phosphate oxidase family protein [Ectothiorhodospiraceae bacterium 2226]|nr:pyridoxamine 5'-phosphate oxidase family protein [Ectothiorhodospiraceae bacterium 2226]
MAKTYPEIDARLAQWIAAQPLFFVGTAPRAGEHVNLSPRGLDTLRVLAPREVAFLDLTGSGNETAAHLHENGRITLMLCAFEGDPRILRLYGRGEVVTPRDARWGALRAHFGAPVPGERQIVRIDVQRVQTSCGFGVPLMAYQGQRDVLPRWAERKGPDGIRAYWAEKNARSLDDLPTPTPAEDAER